MSCQPDGDYPPNCAYEDERELSCVFTELAISSNQAERTRICCSKSADRDQVSGHSSRSPSLSHCDADRNDFKARVEEEEGR